MLTFSTDDLPPHERFAHWREVRAKNIFGVTVELERAQQPQFNGDFSARSVGGATVVEMHASPYRVRRTDADIDRAPSDSLCIYQQLDGACWFDTGRSGEFIIAAGILATSHSDLCYTTTPTTDHGFHLRLVKIPFALCGPLPGPKKDLTAQIVPVNPGVTALFASYFQAFVAQASYLQGAAAEAAVQTLGQLAVLARGAASISDEPSREALRAGRLQAIHRLIERDLHRPELSAATAAASLGISVRQVHLLFEPTGTSFARDVLARRLARARRILAAAPQRPVVDVAFECGFESVATFYRTFRSAYGMAPRDAGPVAAET
jgi:AraC-like DNA-binding protein